MFQYLNSFLKESEPEKSPAKSCNQIVPRRETQEKKTEKVHYKNRLVVYLVSNNEEAHPEQEPRFKATVETLTYTSCVLKPVEESRSNQGDWIENHWKTLHVKAFLFLQAIMMLNDHFEITDPQKVAWKTFIFDVLQLSLNKISIKW